MRYGCGALLPVGYAGQGYEVIAFTRDGTEESIGWTEEDDGGNLARGVRVWPRYVAYSVVEVQSGAVVVSWARDA